MPLKSFFEHYADSTGLPCIPNADWRAFRNSHSRDDIRKAYADHIHNNQVPFPFTQAKESKVRKLFIDFYNSDLSSWISDIDPQLVSEKFKYHYKYLDHPLGVISKAHNYNLVSNWFQQQNRLACSSFTTPSPLKIWNDRELLASMNWHWWRDSVLGSSNIDATTVRSGFRIGTYTATQFKPSVAKILYEKHQARNVLDTSCGWGDRLAGFWASRCTESYVGCDPNPAVYEIYKKQCETYDRWLGNLGTLTEYENYFEYDGFKRVRIYNLPMEDVDWTQHSNEFDFYFTSPPYFETEKYAEGIDDSTQSWNRYDTFESWRDGFFFTGFNQIWPTLQSGAAMSINIIEPQGKGKRYKLCDSMVDYCLTLPDCNYIGKYGMQMMGRPNTQDVRSIYIEPSWTFSKN